MSLGGATLFVRNLCRHSVHIHHILGIQKKWEMMSIGDIQYYECLAEDDVLELIKREDYDLIHWHWWQPLELMRFLAGTEIDIPHMITVHVYGAQAPYQLTDFERRFARKIVLVTPAALDLPENRLIPPQKVAVINAGADLAPFLNLKPAPHSGFTIGRASALNRFKCPPDLIDSLRRIDIPNVRFVIAGDGELKEAFEKKLALNGDGCRFSLPGFIIDMLAFYAGLDLYCYQLPAHSYAASELNIQEAMAAALPIVLLSSPGTRHLIEHRVTGMVASDVCEMVEYCKELYADPMARKKLGRNAKERVTAEFGIQNSVIAYDRLFEATAAYDPAPVSKAM